MATAVLNLQPCFRQHVQAHFCGVEGERGAWFSGMNESKDVTRLLVLCPIQMVSSRFRESRLTPKGNSVSTGFEKLRGSSGGAWWTIWAHICCHSHQFGQCVIPGFQDSRIPGFQYQEGPDLLVTAPHPAGQRERESRKVRHQNTEQEGR